MILKAEKPQKEEYLGYPKKLETLCDFIRKRRLDLKLTAKELAEKFGIDQDTIYSWEYHKTSPNPRRLEKITEFLGQVPDIQIRQFYGERILAFRKTCGISQSKLAKILGVHKTTLHQWEKNERCPSNQFLERLLLILDGSSSKEKRNR